MTMHTHGDMQRCQDMLKQLNEYIDDEIDATLCQELERHLAHCTDCRVVLDTLTKTVKLYHSLHEEPRALDPAVEARLMRCLNLNHAE